VPSCLPLSAQVEQLGGARRVGGEVDDKLLLVSVFLETKSSSWASLQESFVATAIATDSSC